MSSGTHASRGHRHRDDVIMAAAGALTFALCALVAHNGRVGSAERRLFHAINDLPAWLYRPMWVFQQLGNIVIALGIVLLLAAILRRPRLAAGAVAALVGKLAFERAVKRIVERARPGTTIGDIVVRGNVPIHGLSFVSGHAVITAAMAVILTPHLPRPWKLTPWLVVLLNGVARVYVGAHNPLDIVGGVGVGLVIGAILNLAVAPSSHRADAPDDRAAVTTLFPPTVAPL